MKKRIFKKTYPTQYMYVGNTDAFQYREDTYIVHETTIDDTPVCFYRRESTITYKTVDGGNTFTEESDNMIAVGDFTAVGVTFDEIIEQIIPSTDGIVKEITEVTEADGE